MAHPAALIAARLAPRAAARAPRLLAGAAAGLGLLLLLIAVVAVLAIRDAQCDPGGGASSAAPPGDTIPANLVPLYREAERAYRVNWLLLASIHKTESAFGTNPGVSTAGAQGQMQFMPATWAAYKHAHRAGRRPASYPYRRAPHPNVQDAFDAIMAAGRYLRASAGGPLMRLSLAPGSRTYRAVFAYNHADWYVREIVARAIDWQASAARRDAPQPDAPGDPVARRASLTAPGPAPAPAAAAAAGGGGLRWPVPGAHDVLSPFGWRASTNTFHAGLDLARPAGTPVLAIAAGVVVYRGVISGYGNFVCVRHRVTLTSCSAHLSAFAVRRVGQVVVAGEVIGRVGCTGHCFGPHLHFELYRASMWVKGAAVDPLPLLHGATADATADDGGAASVEDAGAAPAGCDGAEAPPAELSAPTGGPLAWPLAIRGRLGGGPNVPGSTHDPRRWPPGWRSDNAVDIIVPAGTRVLAVDTGGVSRSSGFGPLAAGGRLAGQRLTLEIAGNAFYYAHLSRIAPGVRPGARVTRGRLLGYSGTANGVAHLHLAARSGNPLTLLGANQ